MPDVVCWNLQDAQDEIQEAGVFVSRSRDATGEGRSQLLDRNWLVVAQEPAPGEPIEEGSPLLHVVRYGEDHQCGDVVGGPVVKYMPDVVCWNLQDAQNEIQKAGVFFSRSEDATGQGRIQLIDRNWTVVSQTPEPGAAFGEGDATLFVRLNTEDHGCP